MSISKKVVGIYSNLPSGGAQKTLNSTSTYLARNYIIRKLIEPKYRISSFIHYLYIAIFVSPHNQKELAKRYELNLLIAYHSWLVKTPSILKFTDIPKIYICHETMREYYDPEFIQLETIREKIVNIFRLPIKWIDRANVRSKDVTIIANSLRSKKIIDRAYNIKSLVIYPGIKTSEYSNNVSIRKQNQIICVSAINKYKRQEFIVDVVSRISEKNRPKLVLIGNGFDEEYRNLIISKANKLKVKVKIRVNISEKQKILELNKSKLFIYAPVGEPFGLVVEEAIASGIPIAVHKDGGGFTEVITKKNGLIFDTLNPDIWGNRIESLIKNKQKLLEYSHFNRSYAVKNLDENFMNSKIDAVIKSKL